MCEEEQFHKLERRVDAVEDRLTKVETLLDEMRREVSTSFVQINTGIQNLANDFGTRMNTIDAKIVEEKVKWGDTLRKILLWGAITIFAGAAVAMGVSIWNNFHRHDLIK